MEYDLELDRAVREIKKQKARLVCIQLPDGLKPEANKIKDILEKNTDAEILIWLGSCYGACDVPKLDDVDLLIQWGHSEWEKMN
jgi:2-(3-amino-3-carboxypropyl)histidine synthase